MKICCKYNFDTEEINVYQSYADEKPSLVITKLEAQLLLQMIQVLLSDKQ